jgi:hypothetical protein
MTNETEWSDPTVYVPYRVRVELVRHLPDPDQPGREVESMDRSAHYVTLTPGFVFLCDPGGGLLNIPVEDVSSLRVVVTERPPDYVRLRERYPMAYEPWHPHDFSGLASPDPGITLRQLANKLGRPPSHLITKARELGGDLSQDDDTEANTDGAPTTSHADRFVADHYVVHVSTKPEPKVYAVLARHGVPGGDVYRLDTWGFAAHLHAGKAERIAADPDVIEIEPDTADRLAPHLRQPAEIRVPAYYLVGIRRTCRPTAVAARAGVVPEIVFRSINGFAAELTDAQVLALRRDPDVTHIEDDAFTTID